MNHFTNQSTGSQAGHSLMGRAMLRRFALFPMMLLMLLLLPAGMVAQPGASSSKYIATYDSESATLTFEKYEGESLPSESEWVEDGTSVFDMFKDDYQNIKHIVINESFETFTPTTLIRFFAILPNLETITGLEYLNTANVTDMSLLFDNCQKLTSLDVTHFNTAKVTNMYRMFNSCGLTSLDLSNFNTEKVTNMELMFSGCSNLKTIYASDKFITAAVTESQDMFSGCNSLSGDIDWTSDKATDKTYAKTGGGYFRDKAYDNRPFVKFADGTLTFRCGYKKTLGENEYALNSGEEKPEWNKQGNNITRVVFDASFANARPTTCYAWFQDFKSLKQIEGIENLNTENVTNMAYMFRNCRKLAELDVTHFNTANVTSMSNMFCDCLNLTSLDVTHFNTENVKDMSSMFSNCVDLTSLDVTNFNTANVKDMSSMFYFCYELTSLDVTHFNTENVTSMENMFGYCTGLTSLDVTNFNTANVTNMGSLFNNCKKLTSLDVTHFNTENVIVMSSMFCDCADLTLLDIANFNTAKVNTMSNMFIRCYKLKEIYVSDKFVTDVVRFSSGMFLGCSSLSGDIDWTPDKADDKTYAKLDGGYFRDKAYDNRPFVKFADGTLTFRCGYKKTLGENEYELNSGTHLPAWYGKSGNITKAVFDASFANARPTSCCMWFQDFKNLTQIEGIENLNTTNVTNMTSMFYGCSQLTSLDVTHFNTEKVTNMDQMFADCRCLTSLDVTNFNTANVTNMSYMFYGCSQLTSLDVTHFNTANVFAMISMFSGCSSLTSLDVTHLNTANVLAMNDMFSGCSSLTSLDVSHFNTKNVEYIMNIFKGCSALTTIYASDKFVMDKAYKESVDMFKDCTNLKGAITEYDESKTDYHFANYKTGYFTKLVGKNGDEKIGATGETLAADTLTLADGKDFVAYEPFAAKAASYSRTMSAGTTWATLCLPFEVSLANQNFRAFKLLSADDAAETVELEEIETSIAAGTPVIIKMNEGATLLSFSEANKAIAKDVLTSKTDNGNYQLQGLYTQKVFSKDADNNCYIVKGDKLMNPAKLLEATETEFVGSKPFRAYMVDNSSAPAAGARMFSIRLGDGTTAIKQLEADAADAADSKAEYYDLQGHRLQDLQKGVNIVKRGGKTMKVVIK